MEARTLFTTTREGSLGLHVGHDQAQVQRNRRALEQALGLPAGEVLYLDQVHGTTVCDADAAPRIPQDASPGEELALAPRADAAVTSTGRPLAVMTADCLPVVLTTDDPRLSAVAHAGRQGLLQGVLDRVVEALRGRGASGIRARIGPAVCGDCYEVPEDLRTAAEAVMPGIGSTTSWGTPSLDLPGAARRRLEELGAAVVPERQGCTVESPQWYSHRRAPGQGRLAGLVLAPQARPHRPRQEHREGQR